MALERAAHADGLAIIGHLGSLTAQRAVDLGINGLEHGILTMSEFNGGTEGFDYNALADVDLDSPAAVHLLDSIVARNVVICPTTICYQFILDWEAATPDWLDYLSPEAQQHQREQAAKRAPLTPEQAALNERTIAKQNEFTKRVHDLGGTVVAGTDPAHPAMTPGWGMYREIENMVAAGLTPLEAIRTATYDAARTLGRADDFGCVAPGKLADLIVVDGDPSREITDIRRTHTVIQGGKLHDSADLRRRALGKII